LSPSTLAKNLVEVKGHGLLVDEAFDLGLEGFGQDPHEGLGSEPVLGPLLVVALGHVLEEVMAGQVDVVDDLAQVLLEVGVGQVLEVVQSVLGNVTLPLQFTFAFFTDGSEVFVLVHPYDEALDQFEVFGRGGNFASGQSESFFVLVSDAILGSLGLISEVSGKADQVEVLLDVIHDFGLEESLSSVVHDLIAKFGLSNVFTQLLDTSTFGSGTVLVNDLVALTLSSISVVTESSKEFFDNFEFATEEGVLVLFQFVLVHAQEVEVHAGNGLDQAFERGVQLEFAEKAGGNAAGGGAGKTDLAIDNDGAVDVGAEDGLAQGVEVTLQGGGGVADRDAVVGEAGELLLQLLDDVMKGDHFLDLDLGFLLGDVSDLDLTTVLLGALLENLDELGLLGFDTGAGYVAQFGVLANFVGGSGANWGAINVNNGFLPHVEPNDWAILGPFVAAGLFNGLFKAFLGGLAAAVDLVARDPAKVGYSLKLVGQFLDLFEMVQHGRSLGYVTTTDFRHFECLKRL